MKHSIRNYILLIISLVFIVMSMATSFDEYDAVKTSRDKEKHDPVFIYVLQSVGSDDLIKSFFDIAVVDIDDCRLKENEIRQLNSENKTVLSYLSIGEAEKYRSYWQHSWEPGSPDFLCNENLYWPDNYKVKYWSEEWQGIIYDQLRKIIETGYNGAYLDLVDAYTNFEMQGMDCSKERMIEFVTGLSKFAKSIDPDFLIVPQNAEILLEDPDYLAAIDGIGRESLYYLEGEKNNDMDIGISTGYLDIAKNSGKKVFIISYVKEDNKISEVIKSARGKGYYYFIGNRELDSIDCHG